MLIERQRETVETRRNRYFFETRRFGPFTHPPKPANRAKLPGRDSHRLGYAALPSRNPELTDLLGDLRSRTAVPGP